MVEETANDGDDGRRRSSRRRRPGRTSAAAAPTSPPATASSRAGDAADAEPRRRARGDRLRRRRGVRAAARRDPVDRQRSGRAGHAARARADLRRQPLHARRDRRRARRRSPKPHRPAQDTVDALIAALDACATPTSSCSPAAARSASATSSSTRSRARGEMIFHGIAVRPGKPTAFAIGRAARRSSACRATRRRACRTPTSCSCRSCARIARLPPHAPRIVARPARPPHRVGGRAGISSTRCGCATASRYPAFKGSGDITSLSQADGYIEIPADQSVVEEGTAGRRSRSSDLRSAVLSSSQSLSLTAVRSAVSYSCSSTSAVWRSKADAVRG